MEFHQTDWLGRWNNFESYLTSTDPHMQAAWRDAEGVAAALPMFKNGAKAFWQMACVTTSIGNPRTLGGWEITPAGSDKLCIEWLADDGAPLGRAIYHLDRVLERGLEGKENALFMAENVAADWPFRCLLAMEPMPHRTAGWWAVEPPAFPVRQRPRAPVRPRNKHPAQSHMVRHHVRRRWNAAGAVQHRPRPAPPAPVGRAAGEIKKCYPMGKSDSIFL